MPQREGVERWLSGVSLRGFVLFVERDKENTPQLGSHHKAPPFDSENNDGQQSGLAEWRKVGGKLRPDTHTCGHRGSRHRCPGQPGAPSRSLGEQIPLQNLARSHQRALRGGTEATPGRISSEPGPPDRRMPKGRDFSDATSRGAKTHSWRGAGRGRTPTRSFHARGQLPAQSGLCLGPRPLAPRKQQPQLPEGGRARRGPPRPHRSPAGRVSAGGQRAPGAAQRQPSHRGAQVPLGGRGLSGADSGGAQGPG